MPPKKKSSKPFIMRLSHFEWAVLRYLHRIGGGDAIAAHVRAAIRLYARQYPTFHPKAFAEFARTNEGAEIGDPEMARAFEAELSAFVESFKHAKPAGATDVLSSFDDGDVAFEADFESD